MEKQRMKGKLPTGVALFYNYLWVPFTNPLEHVLLLSDTAGSPTNYWCED